MKVVPPVLYRLAVAMGVLALTPAAEPARAQAQEQIVVDWMTTADQWRGRFSRIFNVYCPPAGTPRTVWGSTVHTDDSSICTAAVHVLATFDFARGGTVYLAMEPGAEGYDADNRRGVGTQSYARWTGSFRILAGVPGRKASEITETTAVEVTWSTSARHLRGKNGTRHLLLCPRRGENARVWGSDLYSDESSICTAAVHAGLIDRTDGGGVTLQVEPGREGYVARTRNGIASEPWEKWEGSFTFPRGQTVVVLPPPPPDPEPPPRSAPVRLASARPMPAVGPAGDYLVDWQTRATGWRAEDGRTIAAFCPPMGSASSIWGTMTYTDDSSVCTAAVHSLSTFDFARGGTVFITVVPGIDSYTAERRRDVTSSSFGSWSGSFRVVAGVPGRRAEDIRDTTVIEISWLTTAQHLRGTGTRRLLCPPGGRASPIPEADVYSDHSPICAAAVNAGRMTTSAGGAVTIRLEDGRLYF